MRNRWTVFLFVPVIALLISCGGNPGSKPVVEVGDWSMDVDLFRNVVAGRTGGATSDITMADLNDIMQDVLRQRVVTLEAYKMNLDTLEYAQELFQKTLKDRVLDALYTIEVIDSVVTEDEMREFYKNDTEQINAQHILIKSGDQRSESDARKLIESIYKKAVEGDSTFTQLALAYNEDETTPDGHLGWFEWGVMVEPFQEAAFDLKIDQVSKPVRTVFGWHIVKVLQRKEKQPRLSFEAARNSIRERMMAGRVEALNKRSSDFLNSMLDKYEVKLNDDNILEMLDLLEADAPGKMFSDPFAHLNDQQRSIVLATLNIDPMEFRVAHLQQYMTQNVRPSQRKVEKRSVKRLLSQIIAQEYLLPAEAKEIGLTEDPEVLEGATTALDYYVYQYLRNQRADEVGTPPDSLMLKYYEEHPNRFLVRKKFEGIEILVDKANVLRTVQRRLNQGESIEKLAQQYTTRANAKKTKGHIGPYSSAIYGDAGLALENAKEGDLVGPMKLSGAWAFFKVTKIHPEFIPEFEKVRDKVASYVKADVIDADYKAWTDSLKENYDYTLYPQNLKYVFPE